MQTLSTLAAAANVFVVRDGGACRGRPQPTLVMTFQPMLQDTPHGLLLLSATWSAVDPARVAAALRRPVDSGGWLRLLRLCDSCSAVPHGSQRRFQVYRPVDCCGSLQRLVHALRGLLRRPAARSAAEVPNLASFDCCGLCADCCGALPRGPQRRFQVCLGCCGCLSAVACLCQTTQPANNQPTPS